MFRYLVRRVLWAMLLFLVITFVTFVIFFMGPQDPARAQCGGDQASRSCLVLVTEKLGLDKPLYVQYGKFLNRLIIHRSLGTSYASGASINETIANAAPISASLVFGGAVLWMLIALFVGVYSALRPRSLLDRTAMLFVLIGVSAHPIWIGLIFEYVFGVKLGWTPIAHYARMIRANVMEALNEDYVRTARAKGAPERRVLFSHVLRNAMLPVVTMLGIDIGVALGSAIFTETVYQLHGLGWSLVTAIGANDFATVEGVVVFATSASPTLNLIVHLLYACIDPRIRP